MLINFSFGLKIETMKMIKSVFTFILPLFIFVCFITVCFFTINFFTQSLSISDKTTHASKYFVFDGNESAEQNDDHEEKKDKLETKASESIPFTSFGPFFTWSNDTVLFFYQYKALLSSYYASIDIPPKSFC